MSRIVAAEYVTLDGVMQDPGGVGEIEHGGWSNAYWSDELASSQSELLSASDALLLGRVTYEGFAAAWPEMETEEGDFAVKMNSMPKYVASRTRTEMTWNASPLPGEVPEAVAKLKAESGQNLLIYGSAALVNSLMQHNLIDLYRLMIFPVVLGSGKRLFPGDADPLALRLADRRTTANGVLIADYESQSAAHSQDGREAS
jgi:dihydrofolate reductase